MKSLILAIVFIPTIMLGQGWEKTFHIGTGYSVKQTNDDGYIIAGQSKLNGHQTDYDLSIIKTDTNGDIIWDREYISTEGSYHGRSIQQTADGGYIVAGYVYTRTNDTTKVYLLKTDNNGIVSWAKTYGSNLTNIGISIQQTNDNGYIITGYTRPIYEDPDFYLIKTDSLGDTLWTKEYGGYDDDFGYSVQQTTDSGYIIAGYTGLYGNHLSCDVLLIKTDINGDTVWTKTYNGPQNGDVGYSVQQTTDGGYIITGYTGEYVNENTNVYLIKTDQNGDTLWTNTYGQYCKGNSVQLTSDGGYIITGSTSSSNGTDVYLLKTNEYGDFLWSKNFGGESTDIGYSVQQTTDDGYIVTGYSFLPENNWWSNIYLVKTDENGIITNTTEIPFHKPTGKLIKLVDLSGKEIAKPDENKPYIEIYDNGTTLKKMNIK